MHASLGVRVGGGGGGERVHLVVRYCARRCERRDTFDTSRWRLTDVRDSGTFPSFPTALQRPPPPQSHAPKTPHHHHTHTLNLELRTKLLPRSVTYSGREQEERKAIKTYPTL